MIDLTLKSVLLLLLTVFSIPLFASDKLSITSTPEDARQESSENGKGYIVICGVIVPGEKQPSPLALFTNALAEDSDLAKITESFELAWINAFSIGHARTNQCVNPNIADKYGWPCSVNIYLPGATRHMKQIEIVKQSPTKRHPNISKEQISNIINEAKQIFEQYEKKLQAVLDEYEVTDVNDASLKKNISAQLDVAKLFAESYNAQEAVEHLDRAIKLIKKEDRKDERIEKLSFQKGSVYFESNEFKAAAKELAKFATSFKKSDLMPSARMLEAKALYFSDDKKGAIKALKAITKNRKLESVHDEAKAFLDGLENNEGGFVDLLTPHD